MEERKIRSVRHLEKNCDNCGSKFNVMEESHPTTEKGEIRCSNCGFKIHEWNGGRICYLRQLAGPTKQNYKIFEFKKECETCGATYSISQKHSTSRDGGKLECEFCNTIIHEWKSGNQCEMKKLSKPTKDYKTPKDEDTEDVFGELNAY
ncbi:MAG: hypothetical protein FWE23_06965 [Chitinivibrionia bacterium]|nr:hypothetical protein [Chitinivibrionia bacterium]